MLYDPTARTLTLGTKDCHCGDGTRLTRLPCPICNGTGRGPRGGARGCRKCNGFGTAYDQNIREACGSCAGAYQDAQPENFTDYAPSEAVADLAATLTVVRQDRGATFVESYLGLGLWSCTDYGRAWEGADDTLLADIRGRLAGEDRRVQACKVVRKYERADTTAELCDRLVILLTRSGYSIVAA